LPETTGGRGGAPAWPRAVPGVTARLPKVELPSLLGDGFDVPVPEGPARTFWPGALPPGLVDRLGGSGGRLGGAVSVITRSTLAKVLCSSATTVDGGGGSEGSAVEGKVSAIWRGPGQRE
jgi:hypothetical protein